MRFNFAVRRLQNNRFFLKISKEIGKASRKSLARAKRASLTRPSRSLFSASFQTFCLTARAYLNTKIQTVLQSTQYMDTQHIELLTDLHDML